MTPQEAFLQPEERSGFAVSAARKQVWAVELLLLEQLDRVCRQHGLRYFAAGGTLLGAVRHAGFIPWDDDIDLFMLRPEYDRLLAVAPQAFAAPVFFQCVQTDRRYSRGHAQLRHSGTTAILPGEGRVFPFNQGIFIDIFPLDAVPDDPAELRALRRHLLLCERLLNIGVRYPANPHKTLPKTLLHAAAMLLPYRAVCRRRDALAGRYNGRPAARVAPLTFQAQDDRLLYPAESFRQVQYLPFEYTTVPVPAGYDAVLRVQYGDYWQPRREPSFHDGAFFDPGRSYRDYTQ